MAVRKEIIVLNGGGHKGVVKISGVLGKDNYAKVSCSLDFRPSGATLYLIGDNIAKIALKDVNSDFEVPFCANSDTGCVLRSSSLTMFGGRRVKSEMLAQIDEYNQKTARAEGAKSAGEQCRKEKQTESGGRSDKAVDEKLFERGIDGVVCSAVDTASPSNGEAVERNADDGKNSEPKRHQYVGVSSKSEVNPLGEWTKYDGNNFYYAIKPQIDEMFICYPEEKLLGNTVPNSKWVRVDAEDGYYVVGLLYDDDSPAYICYGVPQYHANDGSARRAPAELENMGVWLPVSGGEEIDGYWMIYQSARTGEIIK